MTPTEQIKAKFDIKCNICGSKDVQILKSTNYVNMDSNEDTLRDLFISCNHCTGRDADFWLEVDR